MTKQPEIKVSVEMKLSINGVDCKYPQNLDEDTVQQIGRQIMGLCLGRDSIPAVTVGAEQPESVEKYMNRYSPDTHHEKILVLAFFLKQVEKVNPFQPAHIKELFPKAMEPTPANLPYEFKGLVKKGWITKEKKKGKSSGNKPLYYVTNTGREALDNNFANTSTSKRKKTARRKKAGGLAMNTSKNDLVKKLNQIRLLADECIEALSDGSVSSSGKETVGDSVKSGDIIVAITEEITSGEDAEIIAEKILDKPSVPNRVLLVFYICYKYFHEVWLTCGDIEKLTTELNAPVSAPIVHRAIANPLKKHLMKRPKSQGKVAAYKLKRPGVKHFEEVLFSDEKE